MSKPQKMIKLVMTMVSRIGCDGTDILIALPRVVI